MLSSEENGSLDSALAAELDSLRQLRRRSISSPSNQDPDLPLPSATANPQPTSPTSPTSPLNPAASDSDTPLTGALSSLLWLPARVHPEIAPQEFRAFLKEQTNPENLLRRHGSLDRRKSTLSRQYTPSSEDGLSPESPQPTNNWNRSSLDTLTISDLQRLEELTNELGAGPSQESDARLKSLLSRSMSLGTPADPTSEADSPLIVPAPGSILRRSARTKIRKPSLLGDGGGHRFGPSKRGTGRLSGASADLSASGADTSTEFESEDSHAPLHTSSDVQLEESTPASEPVAPFAGQRTSAPILSLDTHNLSNAIERASLHQRSVSGDSFLDAYASSPDRERPSWPDTPATEPPDSGKSHSSAFSNPSEAPAMSPASIPLPASPAKQPFVHPQALPRLAPPPAQPLAQVPSPVRPDKEKPDREKRSAWARLVGRTITKEEAAEAEDNASLASSTSSKKGKKKQRVMTDAVDDAVAAKRAKDSREAREREGKEGSGFLGGLFGGKRRADVENPQTFQPQEISPTASGMLGPDGRYTNFYRLPLHVERAIYRLSHIKLANPRRPLLEQVLISNLMFNYLAILQTRVPSHIQQNQPSSSAQTFSGPTLLPYADASSHHSTPDHPTASTEHDRSPNHEDWQPQGAEESVNTDFGPSHNHRDRPRSAESSPVPPLAAVAPEEPVVVAEERPPPSPPVPIQKRTPSKDFEVLRSSPASPSRVRTSSVASKPPRPGMPPRESTYSNGASAPELLAVKSPDWQRRPVSPSDGS